MSLAVASLLCAILVALVGWVAIAAGLAAKAGRAMGTLDRVDQSLQEIKIEFHAQVREDASQFDQLHGEIALQATTMARHGDAIDRLQNSVSRIEEVVFPPRKD